LPEDYRVLAVAGNLDGAALPGVQPLLRRAGDLRRNPVALWAGLALLVGLLIASSASARLASLRLLGRSLHAGQAAGDASFALLRSKRFWGLVVAALLIGGLLFTCSLMMTKGGRERPAALADRGAWGGDAYKEQAKVGRALEKERADEAMAPAAPPESLAPQAAEPARQPARPSRRRGGKKRKAKEERQRPEELFEELRRKSNAQNGLEGARENLDHLGRVEGSMDGDDEDGVAQIDPPSLQLDKNAPADDEPTPDPAEAPGGSAGEPEPMTGDLPAADRVTDGLNRKGGAVAEDEKKSKDVEMPETRAAEQPSAKKPKPVVSAEQLNGLRDFRRDVGKAAGLLPQTTSGWQVGLRSLVLRLDAVGNTLGFQRPGGDSRLRVELIRERALVSFAGLAALVAFLLAIALPHAARLNAVALLLIALGACGVTGSLVSSATAASLLNAVTLGLLVATPVLLLVALGRLWATHPLRRLRAALRNLEPEATGAGVPASAAASRVTSAAALLLALGGLASPAQAQGKRAQDEAESADRVFVPYDSGDPAQVKGRIPNSRRVYLPKDVYQRLMRRAFPERQPKTEVRPPRPSLITRVDYRGRLDPASGLSLEAEVSVELLEEGWQRVALGLQGSGLSGAEVKGALPEARVRVAPSGGYELVAKGPGRYTVSLDLVVPRRGGGFSFETVPTLAARLAVQTSVTDRRVVVGGARAQREESVEGERTVLASLGDAGTVSVSLRSREELSAGASEASAETDSLIRVRRGRLELLSRTSFTISGAGREGFVFQVPAGLELTRVETKGLRSWHVEKGQLRIALRSPVQGKATVTIAAEISSEGAQAEAGHYRIPQLVAQGVSRESGSIGLAADAGLKIRPAQLQRLRQIDSMKLSGLASEAGAQEVGWAYGFSRRPCSLEVEQVAEGSEVYAETEVRATIRPDRYVIEGKVRYDVRRGKVYRLEVLAPAGYTLVAHQGLDVREVDVRKPDDATQVYAFGLGSGLSGQATLGLRLVRRLALGDEGKLEFPDLRPLGVAREATQIAIATTGGLELRPSAQIDALTLRDVNQLTRRWQAPERGGRWRLGYARAKAREAGLCQVPLEVSRPSPYVTGSWVLHARVERDVVRYVLRPLFEIEHAGVERFGVTVPSAVAERARVRAQNQRDVTRTPAGEGLTLVRVGLQSPAEVFYDFALEWEEVLPSGEPFALPAVGLRGVDRAVRGYVLVEKAPEVADLLEEAAKSGVIKEGRAADAAALPAGKGADDFVLVYEVPLAKDDAWEASLRLKAREVTLPPPAQVHWAHIESVFTRQGEVRHRARYRVSNLRLQFLSLELPPNAEVWSVFVAGKPRRLHRQDRLALIPLPKKSAADLSFDVELTYATPPAGEFGAGSLEVLGPRLATERVEVGKTFWTTYLPEGYRHGGFKGNVEPSTPAEVQVVVAQQGVEELARLDELARTGRGKKQAVAAGNLAVQKERILSQLREAKQTAGLGKAQSAEGEQLGQVLDKVARTYRQLDQQIQSRQRKDQGRDQLQQGPGQQVIVDGNSFRAGSDGWARNEVYFKRGQKTRWTGVENEAEEDGQVIAVPNQAAGQQKQQQQQQVLAERRRQTYVLRVKKGDELSLKNAELFQEGQAGSDKAMLGNKGYGDVVEREERNEGDEGRTDGTRRHEGQLSIRVRFATPGRAFHFVSRSQEAPQLTFESSDGGTSRTALRFGQGAVLLLLLAALLRLGLHRPVPGKGAAQTLALIGGAGLAGAALAHPGGLALSVILSLVALRHGPLFPERAATGEGSAA
ncbi:MAG TPA: hypothetical protein DEA08_00090, partial [Planctomycetes bacterium]|nr:hypothetical protein [Planctomycetota bacterium]